MPFGSFNLTVNIRKNMVLPFSFSSSSSSFFFFYFQISFPSIVLIDIIFNNHLRRNM
uniref:Uncharacterized protein n=1 Tax=Glossina austeni TaxID=7395 RepID=A0A1A9VA87_GLOAU